MLSHRFRRPISRGLQSIQALTRASSPGKAALSRRELRPQRPEEDPAMAWHGVNHRTGTVHIIFDALFAAE